MMFPMIGLVSGVRWRSWDPELQAQVTELMDRQFAEIARTYIAAEAEYEAGLRAAGISVVEVGPEFFGDAIRRWEASWQEKAPLLPVLRRLTSEDAQAPAPESGSP